MILLNKFILLFEKDYLGYSNYDATPFCNGKITYLNEIYRIKKKYNYIIVTPYGHFISTNYSLPKSNWYKIRISIPKKLSMYNHVVIDYGRGFERTVILGAELHHFIGSCVKRYTRYYNFWKYIKL